VYADDYLRPWHEAAIDLIPGLELFDAHTHTGANDPDGIRCTAEELLDGLGLRMMWVRLARLGANSFLWEHVDYDELASTERYRLHIPIATNRSAYLVLRNSRVHLASGYIWRLTPTTEHGACNLYGPDRIHLVADCYADDAYARLTESASIAESDLEALPALSSFEREEHLAKATNLLQLGYRRAAEHHLLRLADAPQLQPREDGDHDGDDGEGRGCDRDRRGRRARDAHPPGSEKITGYSEVLLDVLCSPGTGLTTTLTFVGVVNWTAPMFLNVTVFS